MITGKNIEIPITGLTSNPSDYECPDGQMQVCHNMVGGKSIAQPAALMLDEDTKLPAIEEGGELVFVHNTSFGKVYICVDENGGLWWLFKSSEGWMQFNELPGTFEVETDSITHVGNVLMINYQTHNPKGIHYILWQGCDYKYLGQSLPDINAKFRLVGVDANDKIPTMDRGDVIHTAEAEYGTTFLPHQIRHNAGTMEIKNPDIDAFRLSTTCEDAVFATYNHVYKSTLDKNQFVQPFLVRYAYKMYDGNYIMHSSPVMLVPSSNMELKGDIMYNSTNDVITDDPSDFSHGGPLLPKTFYVICTYIPSKLEWEIYDYSVLNDWKDIIQEVCVFITPQISSYSASGEINYKANDTYRTVSLVDGYSNCGFYYNCVSGSNHYRTKMPTRDATVKDLVEEAGQNFRLFKSYQIDELPQGWTTIEHSGGMANINTFEQLIDGYKVRTQYYPKLIHSYNNRINIADISISERSSFPQGFLGAYVSDNGASFTQSGTAEVYIQEDGVWSKATSDYNDFISYNYMAGFFYYPNPNAKYLKFQGRYIKLTPHSFLNGAYFANSNIIGLSGTTSKPTEIPDVINTNNVNRPNWVMTSEVDNPFVFTTLGVNAIGSGKIKSIKSATKAMSEGTAFGAQPLYVFTEDGIYSLSVNATGLYDKAAPLSRETVSEASKVLSIDNSVIFLNERGLMELYGSRTRCLSEQLTERYSSFTSVEDNIANWNKITGTANDEDMLNVIYGEASGFMDYIKNARLAFDYVNYRIYVYDADKMYAYVYDIGTKLWSTCGSYMISSVEGFPSTLINVAAVDDEGNDIVQVCHFSHDGNDLVDDGNVLWLTRPMKFQMHDILKTVRRVMQRGRFHNKTTLKLALWGSRDMEKWIYVGGVQNGIEIPRISGTPYKYFVVGGCAKMDKEDMFNRISIEEKEKYYNKQR